MEGVKSVTRPRRPFPRIEESIYALIGWVGAVLISEGQKDRADEFVHRTMLLGYDEILRLSQDYVEYTNGENLEPETN